MSTATSVPPTAGLEGDDALHTLRRTGRRRLALERSTASAPRTGSAHPRALAFQLALTLVPALITVVGPAGALEQEEFTLVRDVPADDTPGATGDLVTEALRQGTASSRAKNGDVALTLRGFATLLAGTTAFGQIERGANRIYGLLIGARSTSAPPTGRRRAPSPSCCGCRSPRSPSSSGSPSPPSSRPCAPA